MQVENGPVCGGAGSAANRYCQSIFGFGLDQKFYLERVGLWVRRNQMKPIGAAARFLFVDFSWRRSCPDAFIEVGEI